MRISAWMIFIVASCFSFLFSVTAILANEMLLAEATSTPIPYFIMGIIGYYVGKFYQRREFRELNKGRISAWMIFTIGLVCALVISLIGFSVSNQSLTNLTNTPVIFSGLFIIGYYVGKYYQKKEQLKSNLL